MAKAGLHFKARGNSAHKLFLFFNIFSPEAPKIKLPLSPFVMEVGLAEQIDCTIERGHPKPSIKWTKKGNVDDVLSENDSLMFPNPTEADQAAYCVEVCILSAGSWLSNKFHP